MVIILCCLPPKNWAGQVEHLGQFSISRSLQSGSIFDQRQQPVHYGTLFSLLSVDLEQHGYQFLDTAKRVRDRCREAGIPVNRADVDFVLRGLVFRGHRFGEHPSTAADLASKFANNVRSLCLREQIILDQSTETLIRTWIGTTA